MNTAHLSYFANLSQSYLPADNRGSFSPRRLLEAHESGTRLLWKNETDRSEALILEFAQRGVPQQVFRWTGWAGKIGEHVTKLPTLAHSFSGIKGFHLFGGTQVRDLDTGEVKPMICDVPVALKKVDSDLVLIGVIPKVIEEPIYDEHLGIVLSIDRSSSQYTVINPDQNIGIVLQPDVNGTYNWIDEAKESLRLANNLANKNWHSTLIVFGGSASEASSRTLSTVEQEIVWWAKSAESNPQHKINIIIIEDSGGAADKFAKNENWLAQNPCAHVVKLDINEIQAKIKELGIAADFN